VNLVGEGGHFNFLAFWLFGFPEKATMYSSYSGRTRFLQGPYLGPSGLTGLSSSVSGQSPGYTYKSDAIQKQAANTRYRDLSRDYSNSRYEVTSYQTPVNYSAAGRTLRRGNSLEPTPSPPIPPPHYSSSSLSRASSATRDGSQSRQLHLPKKTSSDLLSDYLASSSRNALNRELPPRPRDRESMKRQQSVEVVPSRERDPRDHTRHFTPREKLEAFRREPFRDKQRPISCNKVYNGILISNGETVQNIAHLKSIGVTHVLNTAEQHVDVSPGAFSLNKIQYYGFHVDDLPHANISRHFRRTTDFIQRAIETGGTVCVNCYMGLSRSATVVIAYLMMKQNMTCKQALDVISQGRKVRPNPGFLQQLAELEHTLRLSGRFAR